MKFLKNKLIIIILLIPYFEPAYFATLHNIHTLYKDARIFVAVLLLCFYMFYKRKSTFLIVVMLYNLALLLSTILKKGDMSEWFSSASYIITICMIVEIIVSDNVLIILQPLYYLLSFLTYVNLLLLMLHPNGMYLTSIFRDSGYFLANKNGLGGIFIPEIAIAVLYSTIRFKKVTLSVKLLIIACFTSLVIVWSGTSLTGLVIGMLYLFFIYKKKLFEYFNFRSYMLINVVLFVGIVIFRIQNLFSFIIEQILHKNMTLTGRIYIWDNAFSMIKESIFLGYGFVKNLIYVPYGGYLYTGHNQFLQIMLKGGLLATSLFVVIILLSGIRLMKYKDNNFAGIISAFIFAVLVMMLTDDYGNALLFFILLILGYHLPDIIEQEAALKCTEKPGDTVSPLIHRSIRRLK